MRKVKLPEMNVTDYADEMRLIVGNVFQTMLKVPACRSQNMSSADFQFSAIVHFAGDWTGAVLLRCGLLTAEGFAHQLFPNASSVLSTEDVKDALGELVNMVGGNLKSVLPGGVGISAPVVADNFAEPYVCGKDHRMLQFFSSNYGEFLVALIYLPDPKDSGDNARREIVR